MTTKLIAENLIISEHFINVTEQDGEYWNIPCQGSSNTGDLKLLNDGTLTDDSRSGTTTSNGAADKTTLIDSGLSVLYGDDFWIGATVTVAGETRTVSDFAQATGTITVSAAFTSQVMSGTAYSMTLDATTRDFHFELITGGDPGTAAYKWSHDGGTTWLGRDNPEQATWTQRTIAGTHNETFGKMLELANGTLLMFYGVSDTYYCKASTNGGETFGDAVTVGTSASTTFVAACQLSTTGRILALLAGRVIYYSDDNGATWATLTTSGLDLYVAWDLIELQDNSLLFFSVDSITVYCQRSTDGGITWATHSHVTETGYYPRACVLQDGTVFCASRYSVSVTTILGRRSTDNGATWGSDEAVAGISGVEISQLDVMTDINNHVLCFFYSVTDTQMMLAYSDAGAVSFNVTEIVISTNSATYPAADLVGAQVVVTGYISGTGLVEYRRGRWHTYSAGNAVAVRDDGLPVELCCGVNVSWIGTDGVAGDTWEILPAAEYGMINIIEDPPSIPWRSTQDNIACTILLDAGTNARFRATGAAFFGCNLRTLSFQMNATDSWGSPSVDETITFDLTTGTIDSVSGNVIEDSSVFSLYKDHELSGLYFRATSGTDSGLTWQIEDNWGNYIIIDTTAATNLASTNTFAIYQDHVAKTFTGGIYRYIRISIAAQQCAENYYQIGTMRAASAITLSDTWQIGYAENLDLGYDLIQTADGGLIPIDSIGGSPRTFELTFPVSDAGRLQVSHLLRQLRGRAICLIPDSATLTECYLVTAEPSIEQRNDFLDYFTMSIRLREIL